ncbi:MAG TPA: hypothetical protein VET24_08225 [Actinomycetota bacterium]|nr:hypothetical protein [Actinomycetota bacterium]
MLVLALHLRRLVDGIFWNSDVASIPLLATEMAHRSGGVARVSIANYGSSFLFDLATRSLPGHRRAWEVFSLAASLVGVLLLGWAARRAAGKAAGVVTFAIALCAAPIVYYGAYELRGPTWFTGALLVACLVLVASPAGTRTRWLVVVAVGVVTGANVASDPLLLLSGMAPLLGAAAGAWLLLRTPAAAWVAKAAAALAGVAMISDLVTGRLMRVLGFRLVPTTPITFAPLLQVPHNLALFAHDILAFGNEEFPGAPAGLLSLAGIVTVVLCLGAVAAPLCLLPRLRRRRDDAGSLALVLYLLFWTFAAMALSAAFLSSTLPLGDVTSARYVVPVFFAVAAFTGVWAGVCDGVWARSTLPWPRIATAAVATVFCVMSALGLPRVVTYLQAYPLAQEGPALIAYLQAKGLTRGYASYWDALGLTWQSDTKVAVYPVQECGTPAQRALCRFGYNVLTTWYRPVPGQRTFLVVGWQILPLEISNTAPPALGVPVEVDHLGVFSIYIFDDDVATRLG